MKLAVIGSSPMALEAVLRFHQHGAALTWFCPPELAPLDFMPLELEWSELSSELGWQLLGKSPLTGKASYQDWQQHYLAPISMLLSELHEVRPLPVVSVTKRFLQKGETIPGRTRFYDLFRVIFEVDPANFVNQQKESAPAVYERLSSEMFNSLQNKLEMYEDFDVVLDLRRPHVVTSMAATGKALGEGRVPSDKLYYGYEALKRSLEIDPQDAQVRELALVGSGALAAMVLINLQQWLKDERNRLFLITTEEDPLAAFLSTARPELKARLHEVLNSMDRDFETEKDLFVKKLRDWQELDDFVRAKYPRPTEPIPRLVFFSGHNVTAVDQLIERKRLFLTLEAPDFRRGMKQPENNQLELKTIGVDEVWAVAGLNRKNIAEHLDQDESGFYAVKPSCEAQLASWPKDMENLKGIENEIFRLFSPADPG
jgi:hypothetical protein